MLKLCIVIPTFNRKDYLATLLKQLHAQKDYDAKLYFIVVVDGSTDGTMEMLEQEFPDVHVVYGTGDWWYARSMNEGFNYGKQFEPDYFLTMNDDTEVGSDFLKNILAARDANDNAIIGAMSLTMEEPKQVYFSGFKPERSLLGKLEPYIPQFELASKYDLQGVYPSLLLPGRGMLIPAKILTALNGFDQVFPQYASDDDFCLRARKKGYTVKVCWNSIIFSWHHMTGKGTVYIKESFLEFIKNYFDSKSRTYIKNYLLIAFRHNNIFMAFLIFFRSLISPVMQRLCYKNKKMVKLHFPQV